MYGDQFGEFVCGYWGLIKLCTLVISCTLPKATNSTETRLLFSQE